METEEGLDDIQKRYRDLVLENEDPVPIRIPSRVAPKQEFYYVGVLFNDKDINEQAFRKTISNVWQPRHGVNIKHIGPNHRFLFTFYHQKDYEKIWKGSPWIFNNKLLALAARKADEDPCKIVVQMVPMWVQAFGVLVGYISTQVCEAIGRFVGDLMEIEDNNFKVSKPAYLKVRSLIDVTKPLKRKMRLCINEGLNVMIEFQYERLPSMCFICGMFEHNEDSCPIAYMSAEQPARMFDESIKATTKKNMITEECRWLRDENGCPLVLTGLKYASGKENSSNQELECLRRGTWPMEEDNVISVADPKRKRLPHSTNSSHQPIIQDIANKVAGSLDGAREKQ